VKARISLSDEATPLVRSEVVDKSEAQLQSVFFLLLVSAAIMVVITLLQLFARFYSSVWDRKKELALYRAIGASKSDLRKLIVLEIEALVGIGLICGIVLGFAARSALLEIMQEGLAFPFMPPSPALSVAVVAIILVAIEIVCILSIIVPLKQIERLDPSTAMQQGDID
jgi:putative ABC transport system permease protein